MDGVHIVVLMGAERSGKSTLAQALSERAGYVELQFASALRTAVVQLWNGFVTHVAPLLYDLPQITHAHTSEQALKESPFDPRLPTLTPRTLMQWVGTDVFRNHVADDVWIHATLQGLRAKVQDGARRFVVSDCRFANEHAALTQLRLEGARVVFVRLIRGDRAAAVTAATAGHASSQGWVHLHADHEFQNPCTTAWLDETVAYLVGGSSGV